MPSAIRFKSQYELNLGYMSESLLSKPLIQISLTNVNKDNLVVILIVICRYFLRFICWNNSACLYGI